MFFIYTYTNVDEYWTLTRSLNKFHYGIYTYIEYNTIENIVNKYIICDNDSDKLRFNYCES